jgi:hypothetical protein
MRFACRSADVTFFESAPWRFVNTVDLDNEPASVFRIFEDAASWPKWFDGIRRVEWTSPQPFGVGTTRTVTLTTLAADERFIVWAEDYRLEPIVGGKTRFTHTVAIDPGILLRFAAPFARPSFAGMFANAARGLQRFCKADAGAQTSPAVV